MSQFPNPCSFSCTKASALHFVLWRSKHKCYYSWAYRDPHSITFCSIKLSSWFSPSRPDSFSWEGDVHEKHFQKGFLRAMFLSKAARPWLRCPWAARLSSQIQAFPAGSWFLQETTSLCEAPSPGAHSSPGPFLSLFLGWGSTLCSGSVLRFWLCWDTLRSLRRERGLVRGQTLRFKIWLSYL